MSLKQVRQSCEKKGGIWQENSSKNIYACVYQDLAFYKSENTDVLKTAMSIQAKGIRMTFIEKIINFFNRTRKKKCVRNGGIYIETFDTDGEVLAEYCSLDSL